MRVLLSVVACSAVIGIAAPAYAQAPRPDRPYRGLFGGGAQGTSQSLILNLDFGGGYDSNVLASENIGLSNTPAEVASEFATSNVSLGYSISRERISFSANGAAGVQYYPTLENPWVEHYSFGFGGAWRITTRTSLSLNQTASLNPFYSVLPTLVTGGGTPPPTPGPPTPDPPTVQEPLATVQLERHWTSGTSAYLSHQVTKRFGVYASAGRFVSDSDTADFDVISRSLGAGGTYRLTRDLGVRLGYNFAETKFEEDPEPINHSAIDAGIDYGRSISLTRRTTLGFGGGLSGVNDGESTQYSLIGHLSLNHEIARTWNASGSYNRSVGFSDFLRGPVLTDFFGAGLNGMISRRLQVSANLGFSRGEMGFAESEDAGDNTYFTTQGDAGLTYGVTTNIGLSLVYSYYSYDFAESIVLPGGLPSQTRRNAVTAMVNFWAPLFQRPRRPNASR